MKRRVTISLIVVAATALIVVAGIHVWRSNTFDKRFAYMTSVPEGCDRAQTCRLEAPRWTSDLRIDFFNASRTHNQEDIRNKTIKYAQDLSALIPVNARLLSSEPNVLVVTFDEGPNELLAELEPPFFGYPEMAKRIELYSSEQARGATAFIDESTSPDTIESALVYINSELTDKKLEACILEELVGILGLISDPPGQRSLFDNGNSTQRYGRIWISSETRAMLTRIYED